MKFRNPFSRPSAETRRGTPTNTSGRISSIQTIQRQDAVNTLDLTIQTIQAINDLIPIQIAKSILTGITKILLLLQQSLKNEDDLQDLKQKFWKICSTLAQATKGVSMDRMSEVLRDALYDLKSSIDDMYVRVEKALQHSRSRKFLTAGLQAKEIAAWSADLSMTLLLFSTRLNIVGSIRLEQMYDFMMRTELPILIPEPPPPPPVMFFGREALFSKVKDALLRDQDVVLVGTGGIGKSCIAKALINDEDIKRRYSRRFFVPFDGMDPRTITLGAFIDRIASALGLPLFGTESARQVKTNLGSSPVLLVLDNAETFEDAANEDAASQIASFVTEIANADEVTVILTSRTSDNARNVRWTVVEVPPLEREPARLYFRNIYPDSEISDDDIDSLLDTIDFHPLSIHILAYTAVTNRWTGKTLLDRWNTQKSGLLWKGRKKENLAFTITLSLDSPSIKALGNHALQVLWIVAFFPQGINENHLERLFPSVPDISLLMDMLCRMSLVYRAAPFLMTLAPIRLYLLDTLPGAGLESLGDIRTVYYNSLEAISEEKDSHADLLISDHMNIEHLLVFDFSHPVEDMEYPHLTCWQFLRGLANHKLRPTLLSPIISSLSEESISTQNWKAWCLHALGVLYFGLSNFSLAGTSYLAAATLLSAVDNHRMSAFCTSGAALSYNERGHFSRVQQLLEELILSPTWQHSDEETKAEIYYILDLSKMHISPDCTDGLFLRSIDNPDRGLSSRVRHWTTKMYHGYNSPAEIEENLKTIRPVCISSSNLWHRWRILEGLAEAAHLQRRSKVAMELLNEAQSAVNGDLRLTLVVLRSKAAIASVQGNYELSRSFLQYCLDATAVIATPSSSDFLWMLYVQGRNELYAEDYSRAHRIFSDVIADCEAHDELEIKTFCMRALGEAEILLDHEPDSDQYFAQTVELCKEAGVPPNLLGICEPLFTLDDDKYPGWKKYLQAHATTN